MKLYTRCSLICTAAVLTMGLVACSAKNSDDDSGNDTGGASGALGGDSNATQGGAPDGTGGRATGGRASTGGRTSADTSALSTGGSNTLSQLPKACSGFAITDAPSDDGGVCRGAGKELEASPLDMMIAMDRTYSMTYCMDGRHDECVPDTATEPMRWEVLQQSVEQFLANITANMPEARRPRMGLRFFGNTGNPDDPDECNPATYAEPQVTMQDFGTASPAIIDSMQQMKKYLGGQTPWQPSLQGVLQYAQEWQKSHTDRVTIVLFVTDGYPTICDTDMNNILTTIGEFYWGVQGQYNSLGKPGIRTYILGVGGDFSDANRYNLDSAASAGGTNEATIANNSADVSALADSLQNISNAKVECDFPLPPPPDGMILDKEKVQVIYEPFKGAKQEIPAASTADRCANSNGGWYYDNPADPKRVLLCPCSCANLGAGRINVTFGCRPKPILG